MGEPRGHAAEEIEQREPHRPEPVLHSRAEDPQRPPVEDEVKPARMKEDVGQEWRPVGRGDEAELTEDARRHQREVEQEPVERTRRQAALVEESEKADPDD